MYKTSSFIKALALCFALEFFGAAKVNAQTNNFSLGTNTGTSITTGDNNLSLGINAFPSLTTGSDNLAIGLNAGFSAINPTRTLSIGVNAGYAQVNSFDNTFIGYYAGYSTTGSDNTFIGYEAGKSNTTGYDNTFIGEEAGERCTTGNQNTFIGENYGSGSSEPTTGRKNTSIGRNALYKLTSGYQNTAVGHEAGDDIEKGHHNTMLGDSSLYDVGAKDTNHPNAGSYNTALGAASGSATENTSYNTFIGAYAGGDNNRTNSINNAYGNSYLGYHTGFINRLGILNTGIGHASDFYRSVYSEAINLSHNVFIGAKILIKYAEGNVIVGHQANAENANNSVAIGKESVISASNSIAIGYQVNVSSANEVQIGNSAITSIGGFVNWTATSDGRFKTDVQENVVGLDFINQLRPVTYELLTADGERLTANGSTAEPTTDNQQLTTNHRYTGFIAQEVEQAAETVGFNFSGVDKPKEQATGNEQQETDYYGLRYAEFVVPLVKAKQELAQKLVDLEKENLAQKERLAQYKAALEEALVRLEALESKRAEVANQ